MLGRLRKRIDPYIVAMFAVVLLATILPAQGRGATVAGIAADAGIIFLFFLYGTRISPTAAWQGLCNGPLQISVLLSTYMMFPALGFILVHLLPAGLPPALTTGVIFLCLLPSTVQSSIAFTSIARGNVPAALCAASVSSIVGVFLTPILAGWLLDTAGVKLSFGVLRDIVAQLLVPFLAGQLLRPWLQHWVQKHRTVLGLADRGSILLIIYVAFSKGMVDNIWQAIGISDLLVVGLVLTVLLGLALGITITMARRILRLSREDEIVLLFCGSKKSLASGLPMASVILPGPQLGLILLPLMLFHQLQLVVCAFLAQRYAAQPAPSPPVISPMQSEPGLEVQSRLSDAS